MKEKSEMEPFSKKQKIERNEAETEEQKILTKENADCFMDEIERLFSYAEKGSSLLRSFAIEGPTGARLKDLKEKIHRTIESAKKSEEKLNIFFVGNSGQGKSHILRSWTREDLVQAATTEGSFTKHCTALHYGTEWSLKIHFLQEDEIKELDPDSIENNDRNEINPRVFDKLSPHQIKDFKQQMIQEKSKEIAFFEVTGPTILEDMKDVWLWDTPGNDDKEEYVRKVTAHVVSKYADVVALVFKDRMAERFELGFLGLDALFQRKEALPQIIIVRNHIQIPTSGKEDFWEYLECGSEGSGIQFQPATSFIRECLDKVFDDPLFMPSLIGTQRWDTALELSTNFKYLAFWSKEILPKFRYDPLAHLRGMLPRLRELKFHYHLLTILPDILCFSIYLGRTFQAARAMSSRKITGKVRDEISRNKSHFPEKLFELDNDSISSKVMEKIEETPNFIDLEEQMKRYGDCFSIKRIRRSTKKAFLFERELLELIIAGAESQMEDIKTKFLSGLFRITDKLLGNQPAEDILYEDEVRTMLDQSIFESVPDVAEDVEMGSSASPDTQIRALLAEIVRYEFDEFKGCLHKEMKKHLENMNFDQLDNTKDPDLCEILEYVLVDVQNKKFLLIPKKAILDKLTKIAEIWKQAPQNKIIDESFTLHKKINEGVQQLVRKRAEEVRHPLFRNISVLVTLPSMKEVNKPMPPIKEKRYTIDEQNLINSIKKSSMSEQQKAKEIEKVRDAAKKQRSRIQQLPAVKKHEEIDFNCKLNFINSGDPNSNDDEVQVRVDTESSCNHIIISFAGKDKKTAFQEGTGFILSIPVTVINHLKDLFGRKAEQEIDSEHYLYPIFIPSKGRHGTGEKSFLCHIPILPLMQAITVDTTTKRIEPCESNCLESQSHTIIFLVVEEQEFEKYSHRFTGGTEMLKEADNVRLVMVSIPGEDRGVGFARQMILLLQRALREVLMKYDCSFDFFYMLDDDLEEVRVFDRSLFQKRKCSLSFALSNMETIMKEEIKNVDQRLKCLELCFKEVEEDTPAELYDQKQKIDDLVSEFLNQVFKNPRDKSVAKNYFQKSAPSLVKKSESSKQTFCDIKKMDDQFSKYLLKNMKDGQIQLLHELMANLWDSLNEIKEESTHQIALASLEKRHIADLFDYSNVAPSCTHRVSTQHHACVLIHSGAVANLGYLSSSVSHQTSDSLPDFKDMKTRDLVQQCRDYYIRNHSKKRNESSQIHRKRLINMLENTQNALKESIGVHNLLVPQEVVQKRKGNLFFIGNPTFGYLGEDVFFANFLKQQGRGGFNIFLFDARFGKQTIGGCQTTRGYKKSSKKKEETQQFQRKTAH